VHPRTCFLILGVGFAFSARAADDPQPARREMRHRKLVIDDQGLGSLPEIHVAGGSATLVTFEVPVKGGGALLADVKGVFYPPTQTEKTVILVPKADLVEPSVLSIWLSDGLVLSFKLVSVPKESDVQVDVILALKNRPTAESLQALRAMIDELRGELDECRADSASAGASKLAALLLAQSLDDPQAFDRRVLRGGDKQNRLLVEARYIYRLVGLTYMVFSVENRDPQRVWVFDRAEVKLAAGSDSQDLKVVAAVAELATLPPGITERVVVAFKNVPQPPGHSYTVALLEKDGGRRVVLEGLTP